MPYVLATTGLSRSQQTTALHSGEMDARGVCLLLRSSGTSVSIPGAVRIRNDGVFPSLRLQIGKDYQRPGRAVVVRRGCRR
eukprot:scaffold142256_cov84-Phaeocystis_antarctica.AAC.1